MINFIIAEWLEVQGFSRALIEPEGDAVEVALGDTGEVGSSREVLPQQSR